MPTRRYRCTWDDIAWLDCDHIASWGALQAGRRETIDFHDDALPKLAMVIDPDGTEFRATYRWITTCGRETGNFIHSRVGLVRRPCRFGGSRAYFVCPCCRRIVLRLAVLPEGLRCGTCGRVTWGSRRERPADRLIRKANKVALALGCDHWTDPLPTKRPAYMRAAKFERLKADLAALVTTINMDLARKMGKKGLFAAMLAVAR